MNLRRLVAGLLVLPVVAMSQQRDTVFTRADSLRGMLSVERA